MTTAPVRAHVVDSARATGTTSVHLFGGPYVVEAGRALAVPDGSKRLLAFVALHTGRVDRHHAAGTLWPVGEEERAAGNLRSALWRLNRAGIDVVDADKASLGLRVGTVLDLDVVRRWTSRLIHGTPEAGDLGLPSWAPDDVDLLPGWYDDWIAFERERLRQRVLHAMEALSRWLRDQGRLAEAVEAALYAVRMDPLRESAQTVLLRAHLSEGNLAEARRAFSAYRDLLRCELDVPPGAGLAALLAEHDGVGRPVGPGRSARA